MMSLKRHNFKIGNFVSSIAGVSERDFECSKQITLKGVVEKLAIHCCQLLSNSTRGRVHK